jgi:hypothetical protein
MIFLVTKEEFEITYQADWEMEYSSSFVSGSSVMYPLRKDYLNERVIFSQSADYSCNPIQTFNNDDELQLWLWDFDTKEYYNWMSEEERLSEDEMESDPYGLGPFPEEMDSIGEPAPMPSGSETPIIEI